MSQNAERAAAIIRARKLMKMTSESGASEAEANFAFDKLNEIKETFDLSMDEIVLESSNYVQKSIIGNKVKGDPLAGVVTSIAKFTGTKVWRSSGKGKYVDVRSSWRSYGTVRRVQVEPSSYNFFGIDSDVDMAEFMFIIISNALEAEEKKFRRSRAYTSLRHVRGAKKSALVSFRYGFIDRISSRLYRMSNEREIKTEATTNALVFNKEAIRDRKFDEMIGIKLVSHRGAGRSVNNGSAYRSGNSAGESVNFNRPVSGSRSTGQLQLR